MRDTLKTLLSRLSGKKMLTVGAGIAVLGVVLEVSTETPVLVAVVAATAVIVASGTLAFAWVDAATAKNDPQAKS